MFRISLLLSGIVLLTVGSAGLAGHGCNGAITDIGGVAYIDDRDITAGGIWVYVESNGAAGLQSGGASVLLGSADVDPCAHANPDTLIV